MAATRIDVNQKPNMMDGLMHLLTEGFRARNTPERILRSGRATIVFWGDGSKTVVKLQDGEPDDPYLALLAALGKKIYGSNSKIKKLISERTEEQKGE